MVNVGACVALPCPFLALPRLYPRCRCHYPHLIFCQPTLSDLAEAKCSPEHGWTHSVAVSLASNSVAPHIRVFWNEILRLRPRTSAFPPRVDSYSLLPLSASAPSIVLVYMTMSPLLSCLAAVTWLARFAVVDSAERA
jgi:hypothetical protein